MGTWTLRWSHEANAGRQRTDAGVGALAFASIHLVRLSGSDPAPFGRACVGKRAQYSKYVDLPGLVPVHVKAPFWKPSKYLPLNMMHIIDSSWREIE